MSFIHFAVCTRNLSYYCNYRSNLKKIAGSDIPEVVLTNIGPNIDCVVGRHKFSSESLLKMALKKPVLKKVFSR